MIKTIWPNSHDLQIGEENYSSVLGGGKKNQPSVPRYYSLKKKKIPDYLNSRCVNWTFTQQQLEKLKNINTAKRRNLKINAMKKKGPEAWGHSEFSLRLCFLQTPLVPPRNDKPVRCDEQHGAPLNECSAFSIHLLWFQLLSFVSNGYFCIPFEATVTWTVKTDKRATSNSPMKIAEFNFLLCLGLILYDIIRGSFFPHNTV